MFFVKSKLVLEWTSGKGFLDMTRGTNIFYLVYFLGGILLKYCTNSAISKMIVGIIICTLIISTYIGYLLFTKIKLPKFILGGDKTPIELLKVFSHRSFFYGIITFSWTTSIFMLMMLFYVSNIFLGHAINLNNALPNFTFGTSAIVTILWFMYHILFNYEVSIQQIKIRIYLYIAIFTTISTIIIWPFFQNILKPLITWIGVSFVWLTYFAEKAQLEIRKDY
jgi:hypothetical protein